MAGLFSPLTVGSIELDNRIVLPPLASGKATEDGLVTDELFPYYTDRCDEVGLIIVEHSYVNVSGRVNRNQLGIHDDETIPGLKKLAQAIHDCGSKAVIQITHGGSAATEETACGQPISASAIQHPSKKSVPRAMTLDEIHSLVEDFVKASLRAKEAGFDGVEVHGAHSYLLNQFHSPLTNRRTDAYGGTVQNRAALSIRIVKAIREAVGSYFSVFFRLGADDRMPGGLSLEESKQIAVLLESAGVDVLDLSGGLCGAGVKNGGQGYFLYISHAIKPIVNVPIITTGGIQSPKFANELVAKDYTDLIGIGRELLSNPKWAVEAKETLIV